MGVRIASLLSIVLALACAKPVTFGPLDGGTAAAPSIVSVDSTRPPKSVSVKLDRDGYVVVVLVATGHSATLLFPRDSITDNRRSAGTHHIAFEIPRQLVRVDSARADQNARTQQRADSANRAARTRTRPTGIAMGPLLPTTPTYLLVITSAQPLTYARVLERTAGVSIPITDSEALNAIAKAVKNTIPSEPRDWAGYYQAVPLVPENQR
jgi:hypothetical protein